MAHQIGAINTSANWTRTYVYAPNSSRLASTLVGSVTSNYGHDAAGNITAMPHLPGGLGWDADDRLRRSDRGAGIVTACGYDAGGERVFKANARRRTVYLPGDADLQLSFGASSVVTSRTWTLSVGDDAGMLVRFERTELPGKLPVTLARFALSDLLRSVTVEVDDAGNLLGFEQYTPYGDSCVRVVVSGEAGYSTSRYRFNGKERDVEETGLYYYGARYYACWIGRWVSCDPSVDVRGSAYGFCAGNPTSLVDLDGRAPGDAAWYDLRGQLDARVHSEAARPRQDAQQARHPMASGRESGPQLRAAPSPERQLQLDRLGAARAAEAHTLRWAGDLVRSGPLAAAATVGTAKATGNWRTGVMVGTIVAAAESGATGKPANVSAGLGIRGGVQAPRRPATVEQVDPPAAKGVLPFSGGERPLVASKGADDAVRLVGGRRPINSRYAGQMHPSGVRLTAEGFPDFSPFAKARVELKGLTGNYAKDAAMANKAVGLRATPENMVWHHVEDARTMLLVPKDIHGAVRHTGGSAILRGP